MITLKIEPPIDASAESREEFVGWISSQFSGFLGSVEEAFPDETQSTHPSELDHAAPSVERDWSVSQRSIIEMYWETLSIANQAAQAVQSKFPNWKILEIVDQGDDAHADWQKKWQNAFQGVLIPPDFEILPSWKKNEDSSPLTRIWINVGLGFGTGTHETTQLCLESIGRFFRQHPDPGHRALDFGSGSGILSIAMALMGSQVTAIEVDSLARENALGNYTLNGVSVRQLGALESCEPYTFIAANVLKNTLLEHASHLCQVFSQSRPRLMVLSGLLENDVESVRDEYARHLGASARFQVIEKGEWRSIEIS